jgi:hypothetical protein
MRHSDQLLSIGIQQIFNSLRTDDLVTGYHSVVELNLLLLLGHVILSYYISDGSDKRKLKVESFCWFHHKERQGWLLENSSLNLGPIGFIFLVQQRLVLALSTFHPLLNVKGQHMTPVFGEGPAVLQLAGIALSSAVVIWAAEKSGVARPMAAARDDDKRHRQQDQNK